MVNDYLDTIYSILRTKLGDELGLLGRYEFLSKGQVQIEDHAIAILHKRPDPVADYRFKTDSGLEAILEGDTMPQFSLKKANRWIEHECYKLTLTQHVQGEYDPLYTAVRTVYDIPQIRPLDSPQYRERQPVDFTVKGKDHSYLPAIAVLKLRRNY